jgi:hypothetical protein
MASSTASGICDRRAPDPNSYEQTGDDPLDTSAQGAATNVRVLTE